MFLTRDEVKEMTGQKRAAQAKVLNSMGIAHKVRPDGTLLVLRSHVIEQLGGNPEANVSELRGQSHVAGLESTSLNALCVNRKDCDFNRC